MRNDILDDFIQFNNTLKQDLKKHGIKEHIIWTERPKQGIIFRSQDGCLIPFSLLWGGFAIFWEISVIAFFEDVLFALFGIPFVLIGVYLMVGRFFHDTYIRKKTIYGMTKKEILIKRGEKLHFLDFSSLTNIQLFEKKDGSGTILFNNKNNQGKIKKNLSNFSFGPSNKVLGFEAIPNVKDVYNQIEELRN